MKPKLRLLAIFMVVIVSAPLVFWVLRPPQRPRNAAVPKAERDTSGKPSDSGGSGVGALLISNDMRAKLPQQVGRGGFVASAACQQCHSEQYSSWHDTYHRTMTQVATADNVVAPFQGIRLESYGREYYLTREGTEFYVNMPDPDWEAGAVANGVDLSNVEPRMVKRQVVMTTGSHHMQGYWVASKNGNMLRQMPWVYLRQDQRWVPREDIFLAPPHGARHFAVWNDNCLVCHSTAGNPNFDLTRMTVATQVAELGISCEACHGPGEAHIAFRLDERARESASEDNEDNEDNSEEVVGDSSVAERRATLDPIINPGSCPPRQSAEICGQCHSYFEPPDMESFAKQGYTYRAGGDLHASHNLVSYAKAKELGNETALAAYWSNGACRLSGREYSATLESPCYQAGEMSCVSCHSLHNSDPNDQLAAGMLTNSACVQCHKGYADNLEEHTHHAANSSGSLCYNCHMPHTTFGLLKAMRSHRIDSPRVATNELNDQPNACNLCHLDKSLGWTAQQLSSWYGQPAVELDEEEKSVAASVLWLLRGDAAQRAVTTWHYNWEPALQASGDDWQAPFLAKLLEDDYSAVRYVADKSLRRVTGYEELGYDYIGSANKRAGVSKEMFDRWKARQVEEGPKMTPEQATALLMDGGTRGQWNETRVRELLETRDNRDIYLPE